MDNSYGDGGPIAPEDMKERRLFFLRVLRGMPEPHRGNDHYDRMTRQLRAAVERISDDAELERHIAGLALSRQDVEQMLGTITMHANYFIALSRLTEGYLKALNPPRQICDMCGLVFFETRGDARDAIPELEMHGLTAEIREDMVDECDDRTTFVQVNGTSDLGGDGFFDWLMELIRPLGGEIVEAGYANYPKTAGPGGNVVPLGAGPTTGN